MICTGRCEAVRDEEVPELYASTFHSDVKFSGAYLPHWVLHPLYAKVDVLIQVENWYSNGWVPVGLRDLWLEAIIPSYVQDGSLNSEVFWRDCFSGLSEMQETRRTAVAKKIEESTIMATR